jgi:hypothetical protein
MANLDAAQDIRDRARNLVTRLAHSGHTRTPSPPGSPPAMITGTLAASISADHDGDDAIVGPTGLASSKNGPYGRFLELGGDHDAHNHTGQMWWLEDGTWYHKASIRKAPRPYLEPATDDAVHSGAVYDIYFAHWLIAQQSVT